MVEFRKKKGWFYNGKHIDDLDKDELYNFYKEYYKGKSKKELQIDLGLALKTESYIKCQAIREEAGENLEPVPWEKTLTKMITKSLKKLAKKKKNE